MAHFDFDNDEIVRLLDDVSRKVPAKAPVAIDRAANMVRKRLVRAAPYAYGAHHDKSEKHLKQVIVRTDVRTSRKTKGCHYATIFVKPRGYMDKNVFKVVVAEYGSSRVAPRPFWRPTVLKSTDRACEIIENIILSEVDKCGSY